jgi:HTH-type transcriptional regulator/antitoxin HigA
MHDLMHILHKDVAEVAMDVDLVGERATAPAERPPSERRADAEASAFLIDPAELADFIARVRPLYSKVRLAGFAKRLGIHPGIVVGQLQHRGEIPFYHSREMLEKVRELVAQAALTDGWGHTLPATL